MSSELPAADPSLLPAMLARGAELSHQLRDVLVEFRMRFHTEDEAFAFARHFRFAAMRSALRQEGAGAIWIGFHAWAFDPADAQMQAALAVRHSAIRARIRHIPAATDAEVRTTEMLNLEPVRAAAERAELLARINEELPRMLNTNRTALAATAIPEHRQLLAGLRAAPGESEAAPPPASAPSDVSRGASTRSAAPPGFAADGASKKRGRRRLFGR